MADNIDLAVERTPFDEVSGLKKNLHAVAGTAVTERLGIKF